MLSTDGRQAQRRTYQVVPVHPKLRRNPVEAQRHKGHVGDTLHRAEGKAFLHGGLEQA